MKELKTIKYHIAVENSKSNPKKELVIHISIIDPFKLHM